MPSVTVTACSVAACSVAACSVAACSVAACSVAAWAQVKRVVVQELQKHGDPSVPGAKELIQKLILQVGGGMAGAVSGGGISDEG